MRFNRITLALGVLAAMVMVTPAFATHSVPSKAKKLQTDLVVAYTACPPGPGVPPGNVHAPPLAFPGCNPVTPLSALDYVKGKGSIKLGATKSDIKIQAKVQKVGDPTGAFGAPTPDKYSGVLIGTTQIRVTDHQGSLPAPGADITMMDIPFPVLTPCTNGKCRVKTTANGIVPGAVIVGGAGNIEIQTISVTDPGGTNFLTQGLYVK